MRMNLPILDAVGDCRRLLVAGIGGGYDVFCGLPLYVELRALGIDVHLANYSFSDIAGHAHGTRLSPTLVGVRDDHDGIYPYFPEFFLARWLRRSFGEDVPVWSFEKVGAQPLAADYAALQRHLGFDGIVLVDGGIDSLLRGDEAETGTLVEDAISMAAVRMLPGLKARVLACAGLGAERDITHAQVFENIAALTREDAFIGSCSLTRRMRAGALYEQAVRDVQGQRYHDPSVINSSIVSALAGEFGDYHLTAKTRGSRLWISPLMPIYWFFDFDAVANRSLVLDAVAPSMTFRDALAGVLMNAKLLRRRPGSPVPL